MEENKNKKTMKIVLIVVAIVAAVGIVATALFAVIFVPQAIKQVKERDESVCTVVRMGMEQAAGKEAAYLDSLQFADGQERSVNELIGSGIFADTVEEMTGVHIETFEKSLTLDKNMYFTYDGTHFVVYSR